MIRDTSFVGLYTDAAVRRFEDGEQGYAATVTEINRLTARAWGAGMGLKLSTVCNGMRDVGMHPSGWREYISWKDVAR